MKTSRTIVLILALALLIPPGVVEAAAPQGTTPGVNGGGQAGPPLLPGMQPTIGGQGPQNQGPRGPQTGTFLPPTSKPDRSTSGMGSTVVPFPVATPAPAPQQNPAPDYTTGAVGGGTIAQPPLAAPPVAAEPDAQPAPTSPGQSTPTVYVHPGAAQTSTDAHPGAASDGGGVATTPQAEAVPFALPDAQEAGAAVVVSSGETAPAFENGVVGVSANADAGPFELPDGRESFSDEDWMDLDPYYEEDGAVYVNNGTGNARVQPDFVWYEDTGERLPNDAPFFKPDFEPTPDNRAGIAPDEVGFSFGGVVDWIADLPDRLTDWLHPKVEYVEEHQEEIAEAAKDIVTEDYHNMQEAWETAEAEWEFGSKPMAIVEGAGAAAIAAGMVVDVATLGEGKIAKEGVKHLGREIVEDVVEHTVREGVEEVVEHTVREGVEETTERAIRQVGEGAGERGSRAASSGNGTRPPGDGPPNGTGRGGNGAEPPKDAAPGSAPRGEPGDDPPPFLENKGAGGLHPNNLRHIEETRLSRFARNPAGHYVDEFGEPLEGTYKAVVTVDGEFRMAPSWAGTHAELAGGRPVRSAGEFKFTGGVVESAPTIHSGHYTPPVGSGYDQILDDAAREAGYTGPRILDDFEEGGSALGGSPVGAR